MSDGRPTTAKKRLRRRGPRVTDEAIRYQAANLQKWSGYVSRVGAPKKGEKRKRLVPALMAHFHVSRRRIENALRPVAKPSPAGVPTAPSSPMAQAHQVMQSTDVSINQALRQAASHYLLRCRQRDADVVEACKLIMEAIR